MPTKKAIAKPPPRRLDTETVVQAGLEVARQSGIDSISMRVIAERLSVTPMALYHHVETKDLLVKLVADAVVAEVVVPDGSVGWRDMLIGTMSSYRRTVRRYPGVAAVLLHGGLLPQSRALVADQLDKLEAAGFTSDQARRAFASFHLLVLGRLTVDEARRTKAERGPAHVDDARVNAYLAELQGEQAFDEVVRVLLDELERQLPRRRSARGR